MSFPIIPKLNSAPGAGAPATLTLGELAANRSTAKLYMGTDTGVQELAFSGSLGGTAISTFTAAGGTSFAPLAGYTSTSVDAYLVSVGGIEQRPTVDWTISSAAGGTVVFATAPPSGATIVVRAVVAGSGGGSGGTDIGGRAWSGTETYTEGDLVATDQTSTWICIQAANMGNDPGTSPLWWARMPASAVQLQFRPLAETAPTDGQAIVWDDANTTWKPGTVSGGGGNATQLQSRDIATTAPTAGQVLGWNATTSKWEPVTLAEGGSVTYTTVGMHYFSVPIFARFAQITATSGEGISGGNGTNGSNGTAATFIDPDWLAGDDGTDGSSGSNGTAGKSVKVNGVFFAGSDTALGGYGGGGGGAGTIFYLSDTANPGRAGLGPSPGGGGGPASPLGTGASGTAGGTTGANGGGGGGGGYGGYGGGNGGRADLATHSGGGGGGGGNGPNYYQLTTSGQGGTGGQGGEAEDVSSKTTNTPFDLLPFSGGTITIEILDGLGDASCTITW